MADVESPPTRPDPRKGGGALRADAPTFQPGELPRPANLRSLKTRRPANRLEALDLVPFTPSQGVATPSPNNLAAVAHEQHVYAVYPATPQASSSVAAYGPEQGFVQSSTDEGSGGSFASTFSPFHWPMPVSPTAFPVRQGQLVVGPVMEAGPPGQFPWLGAAGSQELVFPLQPGSPMYVSPGSPLVGAAWNHQPFTRSRSRLAGGQGQLVVMQAHGSPLAYAAGLPPPDAFPRMAMALYPMPESPTFAPHASGGPPSPMAGIWPGVVGGQPGTPLRGGGGGGGPKPFFGAMPMTPELAERARGGLRDGTPGGALPGLHPGFLGSPADAGLPRMNARQRRTLRRAQEREAKQKADAEAAAAAAAAAGSDSGAEGEASLVATAQVTELPAEQQQQQQSPEGPQPMERIDEAEAEGESAAA